MTDATTIVPTVCAALPVLKDTAVAHLASVHLLLRVTLEDLAPWIMICIAIWGIARLFRRSNSTPNNTPGRRRRDTHYHDDPYDDADIYDEEDW